MTYALILIRRFPSKAKHTCSQVNGKCYILKNSYSFQQYMINQWCNIWLKNNFVRSCCGFSKNSVGVFCSIISPPSIKMTR